MQIDENMTFLLKLKSALKRRNFKKLVKSIVFIVMSVIFIKSTLQAVSRYFEEPTATAIDKTIGDSYIWISLTYKLQIQVNLEYIS